MDNGTEGLAGETVKAAIRRQAKRVQIKSLLTSVVATAIALLLPS